MVPYGGVLLLLAIFVLLYLSLLLYRAVSRPRKEVFSSTAPSAATPLLSRSANPSQLGDAPAATKIDISFKDLGLQLEGSKAVVLQGVTGSLKSGRLTAVMGPSGSGKTTFLTTLAGRAHYGRMLGEVRLNGEVGDIRSIGKLVGFVPQDDIMLADLTAREIFEFSARTRLERDLPLAEKMAIVDRVTRLLGLWDVRETVVGDANQRGISGGQKKRVNIGMELVAKPSVLFLDEPTSGLDSGTNLFFIFFVYK
jgi:ABC-type multidrug transport system ATPase subunit